MDTIGIFGGTGFIGTEITAYLRKQGYNVVIFSRTPQQPDQLRWNPTQLDGWEHALNTVDGVINLCGKPISTFPWTTKVKAQLISSRIQSTRQIVAAFRSVQHPPKVLINASAIGYYPDSDSLSEKSYVESDGPGTSFLSQLCVQWEAAADQAADCTRVVKLRLGVVLGNGGMLKPLIPLFKWGLGHVLGSGKAPFSYIRLEELVRIVSFIIETKRLSGPVNVVSPHPITTAEFAQYLAKSLDRKVLFRVPEWVVRLGAGPMADILVKGVQAYPQKLVEQGFRFVELFA